MKLKILANKKWMILLIGTVLGFCLLFFGYMIVKSLKPSTEDQTAMKFVKACSEKKDFRSCYIKLFGSLAKKRSIDSVLNTLTEVQKIDPRANNCHYIAHELTYIFMDLHPEEWQKKIKEINLAWCSVGFLHGTILRMDFVHDDNSKLVQKLDNFCQEIINGGSNITNTFFIETSCYHSSGHVFIIQNLGDIEKSLKVCDLYDTDKKRYFCYGGVFMESVQRDALVDHGLAARNTWSWDEVEKQEIICQSHSGFQAKACWFEMWPLYKANIWKVANSSGSLPALWSLCGRSGNPESQDKCYEYGVFNIIDNGLGTFDEDSAQSTCALDGLDKERKTECIRYMATMFTHSNAIIRPLTIYNLCEKATNADEKHCCSNFVSNSKNELQNNLEKRETDFVACMLDGGKSRKYYSTEY